MPPGLIRPSLSCFSDGSICWYITYVRRFLFGRCLGRYYLSYLSSSPRCARLGCRGLEGKPTIDIVWITRTLWFPQSGVLGFDIFVDRGFGLVEWLARLVAVAAAAQASGVDQLSTSLDISSALALALCLFFVLLLAPHLLPSVSIMETKL